LALQAPQGGKAIRVGPAAFGMLNEMEPSTRDNLLVFVPAGVALAALLAAGVWVMTDSSWAVGLSLREPGSDGATIQRDRPTRGPGAGRAEWGKLVVGEGKPAEGIAGVWPHFRGPDRTNIAPSQPPLARTWPSDGPKRLWEVEMGEGHAGPVVRDGRLWVLDYDRENLSDAMRCLSLADGREIWRYSYPVKVLRNHGMSRTVPALGGRYVVSLGPKCHVLCLEADTGKFVWGIDLVIEHGTTVPQWYAGQCPLIDGDRLILAPGGPSALLMAVNLADGKVLWKTPNPRDWKMTHTSVVPVEIDGVKQYVYAASRGVVGVSADDGRLLWETDQWKINIANVPTPIHVGGGRIFLTGGYNAGSMMLKVAREGERWMAKPLFKLEAREFCSEQQTPILLASQGGLSGRLLSVLAKGGPISQQLACMDLEGKVLWTSGVAHQYGLGPYLVAGDLIFALKDDGLLSLAQISPAGMKVLAQAKVLEGPDAWGPMVLVDGRLILRDLKRMICLDVRE